MEGVPEVLMGILLAIDPSQPQIQYAGMSGGVHKSVDDVPVCEKWIWAW